MTIRPATRRWHGSAFIDNKYYIFGGITETQQPLREFFYLDCSVPFDTSRLKWENINIPSSAADLLTVNGLFAVGGTNNKTLFFTNNENPMIAHISTFDTQTNLWSNTKIIVDADVNRIIGGVMDNKGNLHAYGGYVPNTGFVNEMSSFNTINLRWSKRSIAPFSNRCCSGAVFLPDGQTIMYIGGWDGNHLPLNEVYLYDTINDNWSTKNTSGIIPSNRSPMAVLGLDGRRIIIYGGNEDLVAVRVLNLINYSWSIPKVSGNIPSIRGWHPVYVIGNYMVISFGFSYDRSKENDVILLDISKNDEYVWTTEFVPSTLISLTPSPSKSPDSDPSTTLTPNSSSNIIIIIVIIPIIGFSLLVAGSYFLFKHCKNKRMSISNPGNVEESSHEVLMIHGNQGQIMEETLKVGDHGQEAIPSTSDERPLTRQDMNNILQNFKNEIIQAVRQEVMQNQQNVKYK